MGIAAGDTVIVSSNGTSVQLRAKLSSELREGVALIADEHAQGLRGSITLALAPRNEAQA
jgi:anaerobic selenocysteine-containing dehydrogenase